MVPKRILIIHNPVAGGRKRSRLERAVAELRKGGAEVELQETAGPGDAANLAALAAGRADPPEIVVAAGGDGTVSEASQGLEVNGRMPALAVLPLGTVNVLAREIGFPFTPEKAARKLAEGQRRDLYPGRVDGRRFLLMVGVGFDSLAVAALDPALKRKIGPLAYLVAAVKCAGRLGGLGVRVRVDGAYHDAASVIVTCARFYGGPFTIAPEADISQAGLCAVLMKRSGFWAATRYGLALITGRLPKLPDVEILPASEVVIEGPEGFPVQVDGDDFGCLPVTITAEEQLLNLVC